MKLGRSDREAFGAGGFAFGLVALVLAFGALVTAAHSNSRANDANKKIAQLAAGAVISSTANVTLQEFSITSRPGLVQSGKVTLNVRNVGSITHELVIVRAPSASALPIVSKAGERSVGAVNEEAIPETDKMGEAGEVPPGATVTKTFDLPAGTYVVFCNIDSKNGNKVTNHYMNGMVTTLVVV